MKKLLTLLLCAATLSSFAQSTIHSSAGNAIENSSATLVRTQVDNPTLNLPGGRDAFIEFLSENLEQPEEVEFGGQVTIEYLFVADADGSIDNIIELPANGKYNKEVRSIMSGLTRWNLKEPQPQNESVYFILPVTFTGDVL